MNDKQFFKQNLNTILKENNIYLDFIGIYAEKETELISICFENYDSSFNANFVNSFCVVENLKNKMLSENKHLGNLQSILSVYEDFTYNIEKIEKFLVLLIFKAEFDNFAFLKHIRQEIRKIIKKTAE